MSGEVSTSNFFSTTRNTLPTTDMISYDSLHHFVDTMIFQHGLSSVNGMDEKKLLKTLFVFINNEKHVTSVKEKHLQFRRNWIDVASPKKDRLLFNLEFITSKLQYIPSEISSDIEKIYLFRQDYVQKLYNHVRTSEPMEIPMDCKVAVDNPCSALHVIAKYMYMTKMYVSKNDVEKSKVSFTIFDILLGVFRFDRYLKSLIFTK